MNDNLGGGVSRVLSPKQASYLQVIWQQNKPPLDSELNLLQQLAYDWSQQVVLRGVPSGWLGNETNAQQDFLTDPSWSNWFKFGRQRSGEKAAVMWAVVNGWLVPVTGTQTGTPPGSPDNVDTWNRVTLDPPPSNSGDFRTDFAFLEVWLAKVAPNPSTTNKPSASAVWRYGNVEGGMSFLSDDIQDSALGFETTERVQVQYRIRVAKGLVGLASYPDGFDPTVVKGRGAATADTSFTFQNMRTELGDAGLWRAGDGTANSLGTVDGYTYAIPLCHVFRRNSVSWNGDPSQNLNGAFNRNPTAVDRTGWRTFSAVATLASDLSASATTASLVTTTGIPLPLSPAAPVLIKIGDELLTYAAVTGTTLTGLTRGSSSSPLDGTIAEAHKAGSQVLVMSGRPDGLYSDQIAATDVLDARHVVNPNGFDYKALLRSNLSALLRGQLRANWKRSGAGTQGPFVHYQDKISSSPAALGVTKLDNPDHIRLGFSDAALQQKVAVLVTPAGSPVVSPATAPINVSWALSIQATTTRQRNASQFFGESAPSAGDGDQIKIPIAQFKSTLPAGDSDQVRFVNDGLSGAVTIRVDGSTVLDPSLYTVSPTNPGPNDDLLIQFQGTGSPYPIATNSRFVEIEVNVQYGAGRGLSRRADSIHSLDLLSPSVDLLTGRSAIPATNIPMRTAWAPLWSRFRSVNLTVTSGTATYPGSTTLQDLSANFVAAGVKVGYTAVITSGPGAGDRRTISVVSTTSLTVDHGFTSLSGSTYRIERSKADAPTFKGLLPVTAEAYADLGSKTIVCQPFQRLPLPSEFLAQDGSSLNGGQGLMPLNKVNGSAKWALTDPLGMFSGSQQADSARKNIFIVIPRQLMPGWGAVHVPVLGFDGTTFGQGVNFGIYSPTGSTFSDNDKNYIHYHKGSFSSAAFSTENLVSITPATYNDTFVFSGRTIAGARFFTDSRGLGRQGIELPPFYGVARLFAVYEAADYIANGSAFNPTTRIATGAGAKNLLRQDFSGPTFWIEIDEDGDSTFILNADVLDLTKMPSWTTGTTFASKNYVVEASVFGFDRDAFDISKDCRIVLSQDRASNQANTGVRGDNLNPAVDGMIAGPIGVLPGPLTSSDNVLINYSRTPYQGDAWGSQSNYVDIGYVPGSISTTTAYGLTSTALDQSSLTRPNQKSLEVLASVSFVTTLGTGRLSGDLVAPTAFDARNVGYEDPTAFPPVSSTSSRPGLKVGALTASEGEASSELLGCTERLPLGSLWRDKDFRGGQLQAGAQGHSPFQWIEGDAMGGHTSSLATTSSLEQTEIALSTATQSTGQPGDVIVHVDGESNVTNYGLLVNYRTLRGGSAFTASGPYPGGEVASEYAEVLAPAGHTNVLTGRAYLVRNTVTTVSSTEVSAGDELMMLIVTNAHVAASGGTPNYTLISTNGVEEGYAAADLYRIHGHPLMADNVRYEVDPSTITLAKRT
jgi:hypothetical protein